MMIAGRSTDADIVGRPLVFRIGCIPSTARTRPAVVNSLDVLPRSSLDPIGQPLYEVRPARGSTTSATPLSYASTCCVRSASSAVSAVGSASASSWALVCSDCVPPRTAARAAWRPERRCCRSAGQSRSRQRFACETASSTSVGPAAESFAHDPAHIRRAARNLATSSSRLLWLSKKNASRGAKRRCRGPRRARR